MVEEDNISNTQQLNESSPDQQIPLKPTFSIFDGTGKSESPWAAFLFSEDESDSDNYNRPPISDNFDSEEQLEPNHLKSEIPAI